MSERIRRLQAHPLFCSHLQTLQELEWERVFCRHDLPHFLDVARLMYIYALQGQSELGQDLIYAAALLHDLGRVEQLQDGTPHHMASAQLAAVILPDCGFTPEETHAVQSAIAQHRKTRQSDLLAAYLYRADKASRNCFACAARQACNWPPEKMNLWIDI